jgi:hypothetical protein
MPTDENGIYFGHAGSRATPEYLKSIGEPPTGAVLTVGSIGKLSDDCANMRTKMDQHITKLSQTLRDLNCRLDALEKRYAPAHVVTPAPQGRW